MDKKGHNPCIKTALNIPGFEKNNTIDAPNIHEQANKMIGIPEAVNPFVIK